MRDIDTVVSVRAYRSDAERMARYIRERNVTDRGKRWTHADGYRALIDGNKRLKERNRWLELEVARMLSQVKKLERDMAKCIRDGVSYKI